MELPPRFRVSLTKEQLIDLTYLCGSAALMIVVALGIHTLSKPVGTVSAAENDPYSKALTLDKIDSLLNKIPDDSDEFANNSLALGKIGKQLAALVEAYRLGGNKEFLEEFLVRFEKLVKNRDDKRNEKDDIRKRTLKAWGEKDNLPYHVRVVQVGGVTYPMALFVRTVRENQEELSKYNKDAEKVLNVILDAIEEFDKPSKNFPKGEWVSKGNGDNAYGYYLEVSGQYAGEPNAFNRSLSIGRTFLELDKIRKLDSWGKERVAAKWGNRAEQMARFFKNNLDTFKVKDQGETVVAYEWTYSPVDKRYEDLGHGSLDMEFVTQAYQSGVVFTKSDLRRFFNTFFIDLRKGDSKSAMDGYFLENKTVGNHSDPHSDRERGGGACVGLVQLALVDTRAADACYDWIYNDSMGDGSRLDRVRLLQYVP